MVNVLDQLISKPWFNTNFETFIKTLLVSFFGNFRKNVRAFFLVLFYISVDYRN